MAFVVANRVQETTTTSGTGTLSLAGAVAGYQSFVSGIGSSNTTYYTIYDQVAQVWEVGLGTVTSGTPNTLSRDTVYSNSSGTTAKINFAGNSAAVFCVYPAEKMVGTDVTQTLTNKTISADDNTLSGIAASSFVLSNASGNIDGAAAQKAIPAGTVVGTSDSQELTNKTLGSGTLFGANVNGQDYNLSRVDLIDYGYVYYDSGTANALDFVNGSHQRWAPNTGSQTLTISNWPASGNLGELLIEGVNLGAATITWPTINWITSTGATTTTFANNGVTLQTSGTDWVLLWTRDAGTTIYGKVVR